LATWKEKILSSNGALRKASTHVSLTSLPELVRLEVDVIVLGSPPAIRPVQQATRTIPIVMGYSTDPVGNGFVASFAHPGGNTTGLAGSSDDSAPKQLELLAAAVPKLSRVGLLTNPGSSTSSALTKRAQAAAEKAGLLLVPAEARTPQQIEDAFAALATQSLTAVMVGGDPMFYTQRKRLTQLALSNRMASIFSLSEYAVAGGNAVNLVPPRAFVREVGSGAGYEVQACES